MSRSHQHTPITGNCNARSEHFFKHYASSAVRVQVRGALAHHDYDNVPFITNRIHSSWNWPKDGKMLFNADQYPELMRK